MSFTRKKMNGVTFKIYFKKAYDKVKWPFRYNYMDGKFLDKVCAWVENFVSSLSVAIKFNDVIDGTLVDNREFCKVEILLHHGGES